LTDSASAWSEENRRRAARIRALLLDVDGVLTDGGFEPGDEETGTLERKRFHARDGLGLLLLKRRGLGLGFVTGRASAIVRARARELKLDFYREDCWTKGAALREAAEELDLEPGEIAFVGDDVQDLPALALAGFAACPCDAHEEVRRRVHYVASAAGGRGAVREISERILEARGELQDALLGFLTSSQASRRTA